MARVFRVLPRNCCFNFIFFGDGHHAVLLQNLYLGLTGIGENRVS